MNTERIRANVAVTLVGAGRVDPAALEIAMRFAPHVYAADGGALSLQAHNLEPRAIIGDLDSLGDPGPWRDRGIDVHHIEDQESTDFAKCLSVIEAPLYLAVGFTGDRLDHMLAALSVMAARTDRQVLLLADGDLCFLAPEEIELDLATGTRISLWPMESTVVTRGEGLVWPAEGWPEGGLVMAPRRKTGTSNAARGGPVRLSFDRRTTFIVLPMSELAVVVGALGHLTGSSPSESDG